MFEIEEINAAQDDVFNNKAFWPKEEAGDEITFCNLATIAVAEKLDCLELSAPVGSLPYTADQMYHMFQDSKFFYQQPLKNLQELVNKGVLVFAVLPSFKLAQSHGHICTLTPGAGDYSGRWAAYTPLCMNLGRTGTCFRRKGVNWAFQIMPEFYSYGQFA